MRMIGDFTQNSRGMSGFPIPSLVTSFGLTLACAETPVHRPQPMPSAPPKNNDHFSPWQKNPKSSQIVSVWQMRSKITWWRVSAVWRVDLVLQPHSQVISQNSSSLWVSTTPTGWARHDKSAGLFLRVLDLGFASFPSGFLVLLPLSLLVISPDLLQDFDFASVLLQGDHVLLDHAGSWFAGSPIAQNNKHVRPQNLTRKDSKTPQAVQHTNL